jgi:L-rhamnose-H+ transport protein
MESAILAGALVVAVSGLVMGTSAWPLKLMRHFQYEQFGFVSMLFSLLVLPWAITLATCPAVFDAYASVPVLVLIKANLFSMSWGIAQVLALLCFVRIGVSLTYGILCSIGAAVGVAVPLVFKASGAFANAPDLFSHTGLVVMIGVAVMIVGVCLASLAGFGREKMRLAQAGQTTVSSAPAKGGFTVGLVMVIVSGVLSTGWGFAFAYAQAPIIEAVKAKGAPDFYAGLAVWSIALLGAALVNVLYPAYLMTKNRSWGVLTQHPREVLLALVYGLLFFIPSALLGKGMLLLGALGASVGWGLVQGTLILGGQLLGFASGEWRGVSGPPRRQIYLAIVFLVIAMVILAFANALANKG